MKRRDVKAWLKQATAMKAEIDKMQDAVAEDTDDVSQSVWDTATAARWAVGSLEGALQRIVLTK